MGDVVTLYSKPDNIPTLKDELLYLIERIKGNAFDLEVMFLSYRGLTSAHTKELDQCYWDAL